MKKALKSYKELVDMLSEVNAVMIAMKINPNNLVQLVRCVEKIVTANTVDEIMLEVKKIKNLQTFSLKVATK